jgi:thiol-disulfide isomerase/thioredoxin
MSERIVWLVLVVALGAGLFLYFQKSEPPPAEDPNFKEVVIGRLPDNWAITDLDGKEITAGDLRGKVVFLNVWATWCGYCIKEMPSIRALSESMRGSDVVFVILSEEPIKTVASFVKKENWGLPVYVTEEGLPPVLKTRGIPATFVINRRGEIVFKEAGARDWNTDAIRAFLKKVS